MCQKYLLLSPRDESRSSNCFTPLVGLVDKTESCPFCDSPKRMHAGFDFKVKHPAVSMERQVRRHRTADSPRLFFHHPPHITDSFMNFYMSIYIDMYIVHEFID